MATNAPTKPPEPFGLFEDFCAAAGIKPGAERIGVFLNLPESVQDVLWSDVAGRLQQRECEPNDNGPAVTDPGSAA